MTDTLPPYETLMQTAEGLAQISDVALRNVASRVQKEACFPYLVQLVEPDKKPVLDGPMIAAQSTPEFRRAMLAEGRHDLIDRAMDLAKCVLVAHLDARMVERVSGTTHPDRDNTDTLVVNAKTYVSLTHQPWFRKDFTRDMATFETLTARIATYGNNTVCLSRLAPDGVVLIFAGQPRANFTMTCEPLDRTHLLGFHFEATLRMTSFPTVSSYKV